VVAQPCTARWPRLVSFKQTQPLRPHGKKIGLMQKNVPDALKAMGIASAPNSADILITSPDIAENGMVVPVGVASKLAKTAMAALLVEKNPSMLAGFYEFTTDAVPDVSMRVKMGQSSDVIAIVKADGKFFMAKKEIKVTLGGCGG